MSGSVGDLLAELESAQQPEPQRFPLAGRLGVFSFSSRCLGAACSDATIEWAPKENDRPLVVIGAADFVHLAHR